MKIELANEKGIPVELRAFRATDKDGIVALIDEIFREYGDKICLERCDADLLEIEKRYEQGLFRVLADDEKVWGTVALKLDSDTPGLAYLTRLYLDSTLRGSHWAEKMIEWVRQTARERKMQRLAFWSDTRFERAHAFYEKHGFLRDGTVRTMDDAWEPYDEFYFFEELKQAT